MGKEFEIFSIEDLCDLMCEEIEYDDNDFYITNADKDVNLNVYLNIDKCFIGLMMFDGAIFRYEDALECEDFDWFEVQEQFAIIKINSLSELMDLLYAWGKGIILEPPNPYDVIQIPHITIYDYYIE